MLDISLYIWFLLSPVLNLTPPPCFLNGVNIVLKKVKLLMMVRATYSTIRCSASFLKQLWQLLSLDMPDTIYSCCGPLKNITVHIMTDCMLVLCLVWTKLHWNKFHLKLKNRFVAIFSKFLGHYTKHTSEASDYRTKWYCPLSLSFRSGQGK